MFWYLNGFRRLRSSQLWRSFVGDRRRGRRSRSRSGERGGNFRRDFQREVEEPTSSRRRSASRSRSPLDRRRRHGSRDRGDKERERRDDRRRESPRRDTKEGERGGRSKKEGKRRKTEKLNLESCQGVDEDMMKAMGFGSFDSTKNKKVEGNVDGIAKINKPRKYRQYMNRKGGFNRPLDYVA